MTNGYVAQQEATRILKNLKSKIPPTQTDDLLLYAVGDQFYRSIRQAERNIFGLLNNPSGFVNILIGDFGSGKSHFIQHLKWKLTIELSQLNDVGKASEDIRFFVFSDVNMEYLKEPGEFEYQIIKNMKLVSNDVSADWLDIFRISYQRIVKKYKEESELGLITNKNVEQFITIILSSVVENITFGLLGKDVMTYLRDKDPWRQIALRLPANKLKEEYKNRLNDADQSVKDFISIFFLSSRNNQSSKYRGQLDEAMMVLSKENKLVDVVFKLLTLANAEMIVLFVDELEDIIARDNASEILGAIKKFFDNLGKSGKKTIETIEGLKVGYPSVGLVCASTDVFFDKHLLALNPALHSRLKNNQNTRLEALSPSDIDNLIFKVRELFYSAGYDLPSITQSENGEHEVIEIRKLLMQEILENLENSNLTTRDLFPKLINLMEKRYSINLPS